MTPNASSIFLSRRKPSKLDLDRYYGARYGNLINGLLIQERDVLRRATPWERA